MKKKIQITQASGDLDAMLAHLPPTSTYVDDTPPPVRVLAHTYFGTLEIYAARPDTRWAKGYVAMRCFAHLDTLTNEVVDGEWTLVRTGPDPDGVIMWSVVPNDSDRAFKAIASSVLERWKSISINGHDVSHYSDEHDEHTVYPPDEPKPATKRPAHLRSVK